jgi:hypothetical protein
MNPISKILILLSIATISEYVPLFGQGKVSENGKGNGTTVRSIYTETNIEAADNHPA